MAVERPLRTPEEEIPLEGLEEIEVEITDDDIDDSDGVVIDFDPNGLPDELELDHDMNLAEILPDNELDALGADLIADFEADKRSRAEWARSYVNGMDLLGLSIEERQDPWPGATGVFHPMMTEAVVRFQAQAMAELFPASGPAQSKVMGKATPEKVKQGQRVEAELNYQITEKMTEYRDEMESMLFRLPLAGSAFKKVYYDPLRKRAVSMLVPAEDFVVSYGASDLETCGRYTHVMKRSMNDVLKLQVNGLYRRIDLPEPFHEQSDIEELYNKMEGSTHTPETDDRHTLLEMHVDLDLPEPFGDPDGIARPYIVTIDKSSTKILSIYKNWYEDDEDANKRQHFTHYKYLPGMGFYGLGLIHILGGLTKSATSILRQLIDAGTLSNLPGGLKARGMRIKGDDRPIGPGEFRDVEVPGGTIRDAITFLPYKEPSVVLYQLLGNLVEEGRRIGSVADIDVGDMSNDAPVGTTLALMERSMKVMSGVQARMHAALRRELKLLARIIHDFMSPEYDYDFGDDEQYNRTEDFDGRVDIIPVSDPNAATMAQRVVQYQAAVQLAQQSPQFYDMAKLHRQMLDVLGIQDADEIVRLPDEIKAKDPVAENMAILNQEPIKAFEHQDHEAHIAVHMAAAQDPKIQQMVGQSPFAQAIQAAMASHITEHLAFQYRIEIQQQLGTTMPGEDDELPPEMERQVSRLAAAAAQKLFQKNTAEQQAKINEQAEKDPLTQIQKRELAIKERELALKEKQAQHDAVIDVLDLDLKSVKEIGQLLAKVDTELLHAELEARRIQSQEKVQGANIGAKIGAGLAKQGQQNDRPNRPAGRNGSSNGGET